MWWLIWRVEHFFFQGTLQNLEVIQQWILIQTQLWTSSWFRWVVKIQVVTRLFSEIWKCPFGFFLILFFFVFLCRGDRAMRLVVVNTWRKRAWGGVCRYWKDVALILTVLLPTVIHKFKSSSGRETSPTTTTCVKLQKVFFPMFMCIHILIHPHSSCY